MSGVHLHLVLSHIPVVGIVIGVVLLGWGVIRRSNDLSKAGLVLFVALALLSLAAVLTGESAEDVAEQLAGVDKASIDRHEDAAQIAAVSVYILGAASIAALVVARWFKSASRGIFASVLLLSIISAGLLTWTANLGGQVRHTEIQNGRAATDVARSLHD